jgi:phosphoribosylglycinamide formyltransferase 1
MEFQVQLHFHVPFVSYICSMEKIAIFASGSGTNAQRIIEYFKGNALVSIDLVLSNNPDAYVLKRAGTCGIPAHVFSRGSFYDTREMLDVLNRYGITFIVLAGFLWLIPGYLLEAYPRRIINIHPALLPAYGGKGMYGMRVHESVLAAKEQESGISIHYVNTEYDDGQIIFQAKCRVDAADTPESLARKIHSLEYRYYPEIIEKLLVKDQEDRQT